MDLSSIGKNNHIKSQEVAFKGSKSVKNDNGEVLYRFYPEPSILNIDPETEELGIEVVRLSTAKAPFNYDTDVISSKPIKIQVDDEFKKGAKSYFDFDPKKYRFKTPTDFGYRYVVYDKEGNIKRAYSDSMATIINFDGNEFSYASTKIGPINKSGSMMHIFPDSLGSAARIKIDGKPYAVDSALSRQKRTHFNRFGGTIQDITERIKSEYSPYSFYMPTPLAGGGYVSSHGYHPMNQFQITKGLGTKNDFDDLVVSGFDYGKNIVMDGAFTSQGYESILLNHAIKWKNSPFKSWFGNSSQDGFKLAVLSDTDNSHTGIRIVNPKGVSDYVYDPKKPTYMQFYDDRLASEDLLKDNGSLIKKYDILDADDPYEITGHNDAVLPFYFEIDPNLNIYNGKSHMLLKQWEEEGLLSKVLSPENSSFKIVRKAEQGGFTGWDGNLDLVKMDLVNSKQARNHICKVAQYWTRTTRDTLIEHVAQQIKDKAPNLGSTANKKELRNYLSRLEKLYSLESGSLEKICNNISKEADNGEKCYNFKIANNDAYYREALDERMAGFPLESLDFSPEVLSVLATPYITPRPSDELEADATNSQVLQSALHNKKTKMAPSMKQVWDNILPATIDNLLSELQDENVNPHAKQLIRSDGDKTVLTDFGRYFVELAMDDIMKFFITESLFEKDTYPVYKNGKLDYTYKGEKNISDKLTLNALHINETNPETEAEAVASKIKNGLLKLEKTKPNEVAKFKDYLIKKYFSTDTKYYKMAEAIVDKTGAGLNWRLDAVKDVADWDSVRKGTMSAQDGADQIIDIWKPFINTVKKYNDSSFIIAEVTSLGEFDNKDWGRYISSGDNPSLRPERAMYQETGFTAPTQYSKFFGLYPKLFGQNIEEGAVDNARFASISNFLNELDEYVRPSQDGNVSEDFIRMSHVFLDNHDKPRAAHLMAVDAELFWSGFKTGNKEKDAQFRELAAKVLGRQQYSDNMSSKAVAVAQKYLEYFPKEAEKLGFSKDEIKLIEDAIRHLANGYKWHSTDESTPSYKRAEAFGNMPYEITIYHVLSEAENNGLDTSDEDKMALLADSVRTDMLEPYQTKMVAINELMVASVGVPTLYGGDELSQTGNEYKSKNGALGCRNLIRHDWIDRNKKQDVIDFNNRISAINSLGQDLGTKALADGNISIVKAVELVPFYSRATKEDILKGLASVGNNNFQDIKNACPFIQADSVAGYLSELEKMSEKELQTKLNEAFVKLHPGLQGWLKTNIKAKSGTEIGATYKYNDNGSAVLSIMTNAYMPDSPMPSAMKSPGEVADKPKASDIKLVNSKGELIDKVGTIYKRMEYDSTSQSYIEVENGDYKLSKEGKLVSLTGNDKPLDSTVTFFKRDRSLYTPYVKQVS